MRCASGPDSGRAGERARACAASRETAEGSSFRNEHEHEGPSARRNVYRQAKLRLEAAPSADGLSGMRIGSKARVH